MIRSILLIFVCNSLFALQSPLIEEIEGEPDKRRVTFIWEEDGATERVQLAGGLAHFDAEKDCFERDGATGYWTHTVVADSDLRTIYYYAINGPAVSFPDMELEEIATTLAAFTASWRPDPLNPMQYSFGGLFSGSVLELPDAPPQPDSVERAGVSRGVVQEHPFHSEILDNDRQLWVYLPAGYDRSSCYPLLIVFDGEAYLDLIPTPTILDNLIHDKKIPPLVAVLVGNVDENSRNYELPCNDAFAEFLAVELVPWMQSEYGATEQADLTAVAGSSYGGLAATYAAFRHPESFGNVLSQSGAFFWRDAPGGDPWFTCNLFESRDRLPVRFYMDVGKLEDGLGFKGLPTMVEANHRMRDLLVSKGYELKYAEFSGGHDYICWKGTLSQGLIYLFGN